MYTHLSETAVYSPVKHHDPLLAWKVYSEARGDQPTEYLTDRFTSLPKLDEFGFFSRAQTMPLAEVKACMGALTPWYYHVSMPGIAIDEFGSYGEPTLWFHRFRRNLINLAVTRMMGDAIGQASAIDIGCNCGFFSLEMAHAGFGNVLGVDVRQNNIDQANLLKKIYNVNNCQFEVRNAKDLNAIGTQFDVVLNLGLMYHLSTPYEIMKTCYDLTQHICVIDSICHREPFSGYHVHSKDITSGIEGDFAFELQPTYRGLLDTIRAAGFKHIIELVAPGSGIDLYKDATRRCLVAFKQDPSSYYTKLLFGYDNVH